MHRREIKRNKLQFGQFYVVQHYGFSTRLVIGIIIIFILTTNSYYYYYTEELLGTNDLLRDNIKDDNNINKN